MKSLMILLMLTSAASAQRFSNIDQPHPTRLIYNPATGRNDLEVPEFVEVSIWAEGIQGAQGNFNLKNSTTDYSLYTDITVDGSQNVDLHQVVFSFRGRFSFDTHDLVYMDYEIRGFVERNDLDLNPVPNPAGNVFGVFPFEYTNVAFVGTYYNRDFSNVVEVPLIVDGARQPNVGTNSTFREGDLGIGFASFPASLALLNEQTSASFIFRQGSPILLEPFFRLGSIYFSLPNQPDLIVVAQEPLAATARLYGDSNHDGVFDSSDLVAVFTAGQYEDAATHNSTWSTGDWNLDAEFDTRDLVVAFQAGSYTDGGVQTFAVPEPTGCLTLLAGMILCASKSRHRFMHVRR